MLFIFRELGACVNYWRSQIDSPGGWLHLFISKRDTGWAAGARTSLLCFTCVLWFCSLCEDPKVSVLFAPCLSLQHFLLRARHNGLVMIRFVHRRRRRDLYLISPNSRQMVEKARGLHKSVILAIWSVSEYKVTLPSQQFCFAPRTVSSENKLALGSILLLFCSFCQCFSPPFLQRLTARVWQPKRAKPRTVGLWLLAINWFKWEPFKNALQLTENILYFCGAFFCGFLVVLFFFFFQNQAPRVVVFSLLWIKYCLLESMTILAPQDAITVNFRFMILYISCNWFYTVLHCWMIIVVLLGC